jgi:hypothetical protein
LEQVVRAHELLEVGEYRVGFDQVFVRLGFAGVAGQALDAVDRKGPTPTSESCTLHLAPCTLHLAPCTLHLAPLERWNDGTMELIVRPSSTWRPGSAT